LTKGIYEKRKKKTPGKKKDVKTPPLPTIGPYHLPERKGEEEKRRIPVNP